jgi:glycosyltransferase involved in cell wall biosynthesis
MTKSAKKVPVWLADETNSGVFTVWMNLFLDLPLKDIVFISDAPDINPGLSNHFITSEEFFERHTDYALPFMNLGTSMYYGKQIDFLFKRGGYVWFHQLYLHRLIENYYLRGQQRNASELVRYGRNEAGELGALLASIGESNGLLAREYYTRTFAKEIARRSIGFCSSWTGAFDCLHKEGLELSEKDKFDYVPPVYQGEKNYPDTAVIRSRDFHSKPLRLGLLGHYNAMKNPEYCFDVIKALNEQGLPARLVAIGSIGDALADKMSLEDRQYLEIQRAPQHSRFLKLLAGLDGNMHFRHPFGGEMSATITESMSQCVPSVGFAMDFLEDIPEDLRVSVRPHAPPREAAATIIRQIGTGEQLAGIKQRISDYMKNDTSMKDGVGKIAEIIELIREKSADADAVRKREPA